MIYEFRDCRLDPQLIRLYRDAHPVPVEPQVFQLLACLIEHRDRVLSKEELLDTVWGDRFVSNSALTTQIKAARRVVGDDGTRQQIIRTVHGRGYQFVASVVEITDDQDPGPSGAATGFASGLPASIQSLIGRDTVLSDVAHELLHRRLVTLVGPAGVGKTALAFELTRRLATEFDDGAVAVELVSVDDANAAVQAVATALHASPSQSTSLQDAVLDLLKSRHALLLLDNCEHVAEPLGVLVDRILRAAPRVSVLATSREPLAVAGEQLWPVDPLPFHAEGSATVEELLAVPAIALFAERAVAADPRFRLDAVTAPAVAEICARLDGIPLAIELAAARVRSVDVAELACRLDERFRLLKAVRRGADPRHQTLLDAIRWSYDLLEPADQRLFARLSVFAGPFDLSAANDVCLDGDELDTMDGLTRLTERSMVSVRRSGIARYELLETLREYGRSRMDDSDSLELHASHARVFTELGQRIDEGLQGPSEESYLARAESAFADLRATHRYLVEVGDIESALRLLVSIREFAMRAMRYEAFSWAESVLDGAGSDSFPLATTAKGVVAYGTWVRGDFVRALALADEVSAEEEASGREPSGLAERVRGNVHYVLGDLDRGIEATGRQLEIAEAAANRSRLAHALYMHSVAKSSIGDLDEAAELALRARELGLATGSPTDIASGWAATGFSSHGDLPGAVEAFARSDEIARSVGNRWLSTFARTEMYGLLIDQGHAAEACAGLADVVDIWFRAGEWSQQWITLSRCLLGLMAVGDFELAARLVGAIRARSALGTTPAMAVLRERALSAAEALEERFGDRFAELAAAGAAMPVVDVVAETRAALHRSNPGHSRSSG